MLDLELVDFVDSNLFVKPYGGADFVTVAPFEKRRSILQWIRKDEPFIGLNSHSILTGIAQSDVDPLEYMLLYGAAAGEGSDKFMTELDLLRVYGSDSDVIYSTRHCAVAGLGLAPLTIRFAVANRVEPTGVIRTSPTSLGDLADETALNLAKVYGAKSYTLPTFISSRDSSTGLGSVTGGLYEVQLNRKGKIIVGG